MKIPLILAPLLLLMVLMVSGKAGPGRKQANCLIKGLRKCLNQCKKTVKPTAEQVAPWKDFNQCFKDLKKQAVKTFATYRKCMRKEANCYVADKEQNILELLDEGGLDSFGLLLEADESFFDDKCATACGAVFKECATYCIVPTDPAQMGTQMKCLQEALGAGKQKNKDKCKALVPSGDDSTATTTMTSAFIS